MKKKITAVTAALLTSMSLIPMNMEYEVKAAEASDGMILHYTFDAPKDGVVEDVSGHNNNGTFGGSAAIDKDGKMGGALNLDGKGFVKLPNKLFKGMKELTVSSWVKFNKDTNPFWQRIFDFGKDGNNCMWLARNEYASININSKPEDLAIGSGCYPDEQWVYVTLTYDGKTMLAYEDGKQVNKKTGMENSLSGLEDSVENYIGKSKYAADALLDAKLDDFRIYNRVLSADEIKGLRAAGVNDSDIVLKAKNTLNLGNTENIVSDLKLPVSGDDGASITWKSDNEEVISNTGAIKRPDGKEPIAVNLTAEIKKGSITDTKAFKVTVMPKNVSHYSVNVDASKPKGDVSPTLTGIFFEDINHAADGGLYAELVENRSFQFNNPLDSWTTVKRGDGSDGKVSAEEKQPLNKTNNKYVSISVKKAGDGFGISNDGYKGIAVKKDGSYNFLLWAKTPDNYKGKIKAQIENADGKVISDTFEISGVGSEWKSFTGKLTAKDTIGDARIVVLADSIGTVDMDMISVMPTDAVDGVYRKDLFGALKDLKPKFFRFPGGCVVEGDTQDQMYQWKNTIGNIETRKEITNKWGYYQSYGIGFYEYFKLCEEVGAEPLPVVNAGMTCQGGAHNGTSDYLVPFDEMQPYVQDALDLIEYANGPATSKWGAIRAKSGHVKPFNLKYLSIGNEQWGAEYWYRFQMFQDAINGKYPNIKLVSTAGPVADGPIVTEAWSWVNRMAKNTLVDEHYYMSTQWFLDNTRRYDAYDRTTAKVFLGEYAAQNSSKTSTLEVALAEAAYMTGLERNSDVVKMASLAPLLAKDGDSQWQPDMIWFNGSQMYGTPSYYVQQLFSANVGDKLLNSTKKANIEEKQVSNGGGIILGSWNTGVEYDDVKVVSNKDKKVLFSDDFKTAKNDWSKGPGNWAVKDGKLVLTDISTDCRYSLYNDKWSDYTLTLKAKKTDGNEGFLIGFNAKDGNNYYWLNIGGWGNTKTAVEKAIGGTKTTVSEADAQYGPVKNDKEYEIKIITNGNSFECYIDGQLTNKYKEVIPEKDIYTVSSYDTKTGEVIVKVVNTSEADKEVAINIDGVKSVNPDGTEIVLTSDNASDVNSFDNPQKVSPVTKAISFLATKFNYVAKKNSVAILKIKVSK